MSRLEKAALTSMQVFGVALVISYIDKCTQGIHGVTPYAVGAVIGLIISCAVFIWYRGRV